MNGWDDLDAIERGIISGVRQLYSDTEMRALVTEARAGRTLVDDIMQYEGYGLTALDAALDTYRKAVYRSRNERAAEATEAAG